MKIYKTLFEKEYEGYEQTVDMEDDFLDLFDERYNDNVKGLPLEFKGKIKVLVTYEGEWED
jgi:hypothetical protein